MIKLDDTILNSLLAPYGLDTSSVAYLGGGREDSDGVVYSFQSDGKPMVVKIMAWKEPEEDFVWTRQRCEERIELAGVLLKNGAPIVGPVPSADGSLYRHSHDGRCGYISYLMDRVPGENVPVERWDRDFVVKWGAAVGRMHAISTGMEGWRDSDRLDRDGQPQLSWRREVEGFRNWCRDPEIKAKWTDVEARLDVLPVERGSFGFIHNDPHSYNILYDGHTLFVIDFDVANFHWFMTDVAIALQSLLFAIGGMERPLTEGERAKRFLDEFLEGYEKEHHLADAWLARLDFFVHYRRLLLFTVMQDWLDGNESTRNSWKNMILEEPAIFSR